jgi:putative DNA primase/helicase
MTDATSTTARVRPNLTDAGNAQRFATQHRAWIRYCYAWRAWLAWSSHCWQRDPGDRAMQLAKATAQSIYYEIGDTTTPEERKQIAKWAVLSESEPRLRAMLALAQSEPGIPVTPEQLDTDPWLLACENGTLELRTRTLRLHRREDLITKCIPVPYDPAASCPTFTRFMDRIFAGNGRLIAFVQRAIGYSLTGDTTEQALFIFWGTGSNGKTTLLNTAVTMLGGYALSTRPETFMVKSGEAIPNDVAQLKGARLVIAVEAEAGHRLAESLIKQATGGDPLTARFMRAEFFSFTPTFKIFLATNHRPAIRGTDHAIWRRVRLIPFTITIPDDQQDRHLTDKLRAEWPGILAWAVAGCLDWQQHGLGLPDEVRVATENYRVDMDVLGAFIRDKCVVGLGAQVAASDLYGAYKAWCDVSGEKVLAARTFGLHLRERGFTPIRAPHERRWRGLRLRAPMDPEPDDATGSMTQDDAGFPMREVRARVEELTGNMCQQASCVTDASPEQDELPAWVTEDNT